MLKRLLFLFLVISLQAKSQCPLVYNYLGTPTSQPLFISCTGSVYALNFQASSSFGTYTINWGDLSSNNTGASYSANSLITHSYAATVNSFVINLSIPSLTCSMNSTVVLEKPVNASIQIPTLGLTTACAPKTLTFTNSSTDVSPTTTFTWNFGDGSSPLVTSFTNAGTNILHQYARGTVNCQTQVTLQAKNYCSFGNPTTANFNPINIYDTDSAIITPDKTIRCWPDNVFSFTNGSIRNCLSQGNTFQRQEKWNFGNYWGLGHDSIIGWRPWPPSTPISIAYPTTGLYNIVLKDSNLCGVSSRTITVVINTAPVASLVVPSGPLCQNTSISFTNASTQFLSYRWNFGTGAGFVNLGGGNKVNTYTSPGTYTVKLVAFINGAGGACSDTSSQVVSILPSPTASFAVTPTVGCNTLTNVIFSNFSSPSVSINWNFANGNTSTLSVPPAQNYTSTGVFIPSLSVISNSGCVNTYTQAILLRPNPIPAFTQFTTCVSAATTFTNNSSVTGTNAISGYTWSFGDGTAVSTSTAPVHTYTAPNTYTVKLIVTTGFCTDSLKQTVSLNVKPT
ncbi:MAG: PKD domain-containing protein, partial [Bacteroidia bacterium]|nr:PKD domain-containing protein [Bacteroidia bacterium]